MKLLAVGLYCAVLLVIGHFASKRMRSIRDYYAGGKTIGFINVAFSSRATGESSWLLLGLTGTGFALGAEGFWVVLGELIGVGGAWLLLARRFKRLTDQYDSLTIPDYFESRFRDSGHWLRLIAAGALLIFVPIYAGSQIFATGKAFYDFLGWNHYIGAAVGFLVVLLYITKGGFIAVVWSDVFQGMLMLIGLVALPIVGALELGGVTNVYHTLSELHPGSLSPTHGGGWTTLEIVRILGFAAIGIGFLGSPQVFVRFISLKSERELSRGAGVAILWTLLADSGAVLVGMVGRALYSDSQLGFTDPGQTIVDAENVLPFMSQNLLPAFLAGTYIAMVLAAIMSTIDSLLVVASSAAVRDYWQKIRRPDMSDEALMTTSHRLTIALSLVSFAVGAGLLLLNKESPVFWIIIFGWSGIAATFCPVMILSLFWDRLTSLGVRWAMVAGFASVPLFKFAAPVMFKAAGWTDGKAYLDALDVLLPSFLVSIAVAVAVSILDAPGRARLLGVRSDLRAAGGSTPPPQPPRDR